MKYFFLLFLITLTTGFFETSKAQNISNEGMEFWMPFPTHDNSGNSSTQNLAEMNINITSKFNSQVTITCGTWTDPLSPRNVPANTVVSVQVPRSNSYINYNEANGTLTNRAIHIVVTPGMPKVVAYGHVFASARSAATLILPYEALGQKYFSMNYTQDVSNNTLGLGSRNYLTLVAADDNTILLLTEKNGNQITITLPKAGDVYEYMPTTLQDLTGVFVETDPATSACKRFGAFSGSTSLIIACGTSRDPLLQQLYATNSWGKSYGIVPFIARRYIARVLAQENNTTVNINGTTQILNKGQFYETPILTESGIVTADKLISVAQYSLTQNCSSTSGGNIIGDPEMVLLNPTEFNIKNITLFSSDQLAIQTKYVNVFMKTAKTATFKLNGSLPANVTWQTVTSDPTYSYIQIQVFAQSLTLTADDGFNAIAYGFGNAESYAYSAGTNLASTQFLSLLNKTTNTENASACIGQPTDFKLTLPYPLVKLIWKFTDGTPDYVDNAPVATTSVVNGETLYTFTFPVNKVFNTLGTSQITAIASLALSAGSCSRSDVELIFNFDVDPLPTAAFTAATAGCADEEITFTDNSTTITGKSITKWTWDFGDGTTSTDENPKHTYTTAGTFNVKLFVGADNGCQSDVVTQNILINPKVTALFTAKQNSCINTAISFINQSTIDATGTIVKWTWDMGDGTAALVKTDGNPFNYQYTTAGDYTVTLIAESDKGCVSIPYNLAIHITNLPINNFLIPDVCLSDAEAIFINSSTDYDLTTPASLTYLWDFGDASSGPLNTSTDRDGKHQYNASGYYTVTLTITNANGCAVTLAQPFTVNGSFPKADFEILNENNLCSNQIFSLKNKSTVDFGEVTKVQWFIDGVQYGFDDLDPTYDKVYDFTYPQFTTPPTKIIKVKMVVYSGGICFNDIEQNVVLLASPVVKFDALAPICLNGGTVQFSASETGGLVGASVYSGSGVNTTGLFNPIIAGVGVHDITYTFTAGNGCTNSITQSIEVYPVPIIDAGADIYILAGGEKQIPAKATGNGLTYKWIPAIGLSADNILNPIASPEQDTKYILTVTSNQSCVLSDEVYVHVLQNVNAPNTITPNGDGINDVWNIKYLDTYPNATVEIFDRNGQRIYFSRGYATPFDGNYKNQPLPVGTYYYIINPNSGRKSITGNLTIIR